jgi:hypothetical protein
MSSFCLSKVFFKNYLEESVAKSCTRAVSLTAAFTTHFPEGLRAVSSDKVFPQHICLVFVACCMLNRSFFYLPSLYYEKNVSNFSPFKFFIFLYFLLSNALGSYLHNTVEYFIILCVLNFTRIEENFFVLRFGWPCIVI